MGQMPPCISDKNHDYVIHTLLNIQISFHIHVIIEVKPLQTEIFDKTSQVEELQTSLKNKTKELESLHECKSCVLWN